MLIFLLKNFYQKLLLAKENDERELCNQSHVIENSKKIIYNSARPQNKKIEEILIEKGKEKLDKIKILEEKVYNFQKNNDISKKMTKSK